MGTSGSEIFVILLFALLLFGSKRIPELARGLGKGLNELKKATGDIRREIENSTPDVVKDVNEIKKTIERND